MKNRFLIGAMLVGLCGLSACSKKIEERSTKPNVIVILADDLGYADVGFHSHTMPDVTTPNLDALAKQGVVFENAYASSPVCSNSRLGLSSGRYQQRWGAYYYGQGGFPSNEYSIAEMMKEAGYRTMKVGKTHLNNGPKADPMKHGFDHWFGFEHHSWDFFLMSQKDVDAYEAKEKGSHKKAKMAPFGPMTRDSKTLESFENTTTTEVFTNEAIKFIKSEEDEPFYLQLEFNAVHTPLYRAPEQFREKYGIPKRPFDREATVWEYPHWDPIAQPDYMEWYDQTCHLEKVDPYGRKIYLAHLELMDQMIGEIMNTLKEKGVADNTIIFFSSDNGGSDQSYANNTPINAYKYCLMDGGIKVPMIMSWPNQFEAGKRIDGVVTHRDLYASLSDVVNVAPKKALDGKSLLPLIDGQVEVLHDEPLFWDSGNRRKNWVMRQGDWKLVFRGEENIYHAYELDENGLVKPTLREVPILSGLQLYNVIIDPNETSNVIDQHPELAASMKQQYEEWRSQMGAPIKGSKQK